MHKYIITAVVSVVASFSLFMATIPSLTRGEINPLDFLKSDKNTSFEQISKSDAGEQMSIVDISKKIGPTIVGIVTKQVTSSMWGVQESEGSGSGIIFRADGYIVTNNHVVDGASDITVILNTGEEFSAKVIGKDAKTDLAVVKIEKIGLPFADFGASSELEVGEVAVAIGNPLGQEFAGTITVGFISALNRTLEVEGREFTLIQTDAAINPGNSGGALVNGYGQVIGINTVKVSSAEGLGFAIPIDAAKPIIDDLVANGYVKGRPIIGFVPYRDVTAQLSKLYDIPVGIYVGEVEAFSGAEDAGMKPRDVIVKAGGEECLTMSALEKIKEKFKAGDDLPIESKRRNADGKWEDVKYTVKLAEEKPAQTP
ncbi:MAG: trypsin-like peptidase domain-containing protein [Clostridiales bacterium]|jgi:serine protease Do|nr:trypsin-like peptidase domain-containing protein [Clostridiales bacterium]